MIQLERCFRSIRYVQSPVANDVWHVKLDDLDSTVLAYCSSELEAKMLTRALLAVAIAIESESKP